MTAIIQISMEEKETELGFIKKHLSYVDDIRVITVFKVSQVNN